MYKTYTFCNQDLSVPGRDPQTILLRLYKWAFILLRMTKVIAITIKEPRVKFNPHIRKNWSWHDQTARAGTHGRIRDTGTFPCLIRFCCTRQNENNPQPKAAQHVLERLLMVIDAAKIPGLRALGDKGIARLIENRQHPHFLPH